jgi:hypothetical protein
MKTYGKTVPGNWLGKLKIDPELFSCATWDLAIPCLARFITPNLFGHHSNNEISSEGPYIFVVILCF